jgi:hypothetical protein
VPDLDDRGQGLRHEHAEPAFLLDAFQAQAGSVLDTDGDAGAVINLGLVLRATGHPDQDGFSLQVAIPQELAPALAGAVLMALRQQPSPTDPG